MFKWKINETNKKKLCKKNNDLNGKFIKEKPNRNARLSFKSETIYEAHIMSKLGDDGDGKYV